MNETSQTLRDTDYSIDPIGGSIEMSFTKLLVEEGEIPIKEVGENKFLYAYGEVNEEDGSLIYHRTRRGDFTIDFSDPPATNNPTSQPTGVPTRDPTSQPTGVPTRDPTSQPTGGLTSKPTSQPTGSPTRDPTSQPTSSPTPKPTPRAVDWERTTEKALFGTHSIKSPMIYNCGEMANVTLMIDEEWGTPGMVMFSYISPHPQGLLQWFLNGEPEGTGVISNDFRSDMVFIPDGPDHKVTWSYKYDCLYSEDPDPADPAGAGAAFIDNVYYELAYQPSVSYVVLEMSC